MTRALSLGCEQRWKKKSIRLIQKNVSRANILDLATGTGDFIRLLGEAGFKGRIIGLDRNAHMLGVAREKCAQHIPASFILGDLMKIPVVDGYFDVITLGYGLRYVADIPQTIGEVFRLLRPGGTFVCLDFGRPRNVVYRKVCMGYLLILGSLYGLMLHGKGDTYWHIVESLRAYPGQESVRRMLLDTGFTEVQLLEQMGGIIAIHSAVRP
jgi:demethylmenaquinone methyltransferase/2-methoxy-6-polyprenyl-1,4-benzoquinol methylase